MSYNTDLQNNNTSLEEILAAVNALPEAGSGGSKIETCTIGLNFTISPGATLSGAYCAILQDGVINTAYIECNNSTTNIDNVVLNSPIIILAYSSMLLDRMISPGGYGQSTIYNNIDGNGKVHIAIPTAVNSSTNKCSFSIG